MAHSRTARARGRLAALAGLAALALLLAACGSGEPAADDEPTPGEGESETSEVEFEELHLRLASYIPDTTAQGRAITWWIEELEKRTDGKVTVEPFWAASLLNAPDIIAGLNDGRVELGHVTYAYYPGQFPVNSVIEVPFGGDNVPAQAVAANRLYESNEAFRAEWQDKGIEVMSYIGLQPPVTGATEPVTGVDWFKGKNVRASGSIVAAIQAMGGNPVAITPAEIYEAVERGVIDAYSGVVLDTIPALSLQEVGKHAVDIGYGHYANNTLLMSRKQWDALSPELQELIDELNEEFPAKLAETTSEAESEACDAILEAGGTVTVWPESETKRLEDMLGGKQLKDFVAAADAAGADGQELFDEYRRLYAEAEQEFSDYVSGYKACAGRG